MKLILIVGLGSFLGGIGRYLIGLLFENKLLFILPWGTLIANIAGCFLIGIVFSLYLNGNVKEEWRLFFIPGVLGGFTTFSSFSLETVEMLRSGYFSKALVYVGLSVLAGLTATYLGILITKN